MFFAFLLKKNAHFLLIKQHLNTSTIQNLLKNGVWASFGLRHYHTFTQDIDISVMIIIYWSVWAYSHAPLKEQSDQGLQCLPFNLHLKYIHINLWHFLCLHFRVITAKFSGRTVQIMKHFFLTFVYKEYILLTIL